MSSIELLEAYLAVCLVEGIFQIPKEGILLAMQLFCMNWRCLLARNELYRILTK